MFEYLGYHRIVSIEYHPRSSTQSLGAQELPESLHERYNDGLPAIPRLSRFPMVRTSREWLSHLDIEPAVLTLENVEALKADEDATARQQGHCGKDREKAEIKEEGQDDWVLVSESLTMELVKLPNGDDMIPKRQGQRGNGRGEAIIKKEGEDDWVMVSE